MLVLLTCEHASSALPPPYAWHEADGSLVATHWAYGPSVAETITELTQLLRGVSIHIGYSRLLVDCNGPLGSVSLFRPEAL